MERTFLGFCSITASIQLEQNQWPQVVLLQSDKVLSQMGQENNCLRDRKLTLNEQINSEKRSTSRSPLADWT